MPNMNDYVQINIPAKEMQLGWICWNNTIKQDLDDFSKFSLIFTYFFNLGKYNKDPIDEEIKKLIETAISKVDK